MRVKTYSYKINVLIKTGPATTSRMDIAAGVTGTKQLLREQNKRRHNYVNHHEEDTKVPDWLCILDVVRARDALGGVPCSP